jgi:hypothetical protein
MKVVFKISMGVGRLVSSAICLAAMTAAGSAWGTPRPLPFTYTTETLGTGEAEVEQYVDMTPVRAVNPDGNTAWLATTQFQTEFEYGIAERLELGLYVVYVPAPSEWTSVPEMTETTGAKERLRYVFADPGAWPIDVGLYGEIVEGTTEFEIEAKILLQRRIGKLRIAANLWGEYEFDYAPVKTAILNPTLGATYEITPAVHVGAEGWLRVAFPDPAPRPGPFSLGPAAYVGPTMMFDFGKLWVSAGVYVRASDAGHTMEEGESFGPVWGRMVIGFPL